jgi:hypothetical protein
MAYFVCFVAVCSWYAHCNINNAAAIITACWNSLGIFKNVVTKIGYN